MSVQMPPDAIDFVESSVERLIQGLAAALAEIVSLKGENLRLRTLYGKAISQLKETKEVFGVTWADLG